MTEIVAMNPDAIDWPRLREIVGKIREGAVVAYPTETFYGLGVDVTSPAAIKKLYEVKRRDWSNPVAVIVAVVRRRGLCGRAEGPARPGQL